MKPRLKVNKDGMQRLRVGTEAFAITRGDLEGPILVRLGQEHRRQEKRIFASEGAEGEQGKWPSLSPAYKAFKVRAVGPRKKILVFSGDMKQRFIKPSRTEYIQTMDITGDSKGATKAIVSLGARSEIAGYHFQGSDVTRRSRPGTGKNKKRGKRKKPFKAKTYRVKLPRRDMITKTTDQILAMRQVLIDWYRDERVPQAQRALARKVRGAARP
jgi:hypothetical protein